MTIRDWSSTPSGNANQAGMPMYEGMQPAQLNDSIRAIMAEIHKAYTGANVEMFGVLATNTAAANTTALNAALALLPSGTHIKFIGHDYPLTNAGIVAGTKTFFFDLDDGGKINGVVPSDIDVFVSSGLDTVSPFQQLPTKGQQINFKGRSIFQSGYMDRMLTVGGFFPNGGARYGDDSFVYEQHNRYVKISDNNLLGNRTGATGTFAGGVVIAMAVEIGRGPYGAPPPITAFDNSGGGSGFVAVANLDGSFNTNGTATITSGGTGYNSATTVFIIAPPPGLSILDVGPQIELMRDQDSDAGSDLGAYYCGGRTNTSMVPNAYYASLVSAVVSNDDVHPRGRWIFCTASDFTDNAGNDPRMYLGTGLQVGIYCNDGTTLLGDPGLGFVNAKGFRIDNVDFLGRANIWDAAQTIRLTDSGASGGPFLVLQRDSSSPAASDNLGSLFWNGRNSAGASVSYASFESVIIDPTAASEDSALTAHTQKNGVYTLALTIGQGLLMPGATGGDKGTGTINATAVYDDNVLLTCYVLDAHLDGKIDMEKWDAKVPNRTHTGKLAHRRPVMEDVEIDAHEHYDDHVKIVKRKAQQPVMLDMPVHDADGKPVMEIILVPRRVLKMRTTPHIDPETGELTQVPLPVWEMVHEPTEMPKMVKVQQMEDIPEIESVEEERIHHDARKFAARLGTEHDPLTLEGYFKHIAEKRHLPSMPNEDKYDPEQGMATGSWIQRLIEDAEIKAVLMEKMYARIVELEAK